MRVSICLPTIYTTVLSFSINIEAKKKRWNTNRAGLGSIAESIVECRRILKYCVSSGLQDILINGLPPYYIYKSAPNS